MKRDIMHADVEQLAEIKLWLFQENVRVESEKQQIAEEREKLTRRENKLTQNERLFDQKWKLLIKGFQDLEQDRQTFELEKQQLAKIQLKYKNINKKQDFIFFGGVKDPLSLKKRYKDLLKIFHPDNMAGDKNTVIEIKREYDSMKDFIE